MRSFRVSLAIGAALSAYLISRNGRRSERRTQRRNEYRRPHSSNEKLILVQIIIRHGCRTPVFTTPNREQANWDKSVWLQKLPRVDIPYKVVNLDDGPQPKLVFDESYKRHKMLRGGCPSGQLTIIGQEQMLQLGKRMYERYVRRLQFLKPTFDPDDIYIRTSNLQRTIDSAYSFMAGMYDELVDRPKDDPIILHTTEIEDEFLFPNFRYCPRLKEFFAAMWNWNKDVVQLEENKIFNDILKIKNKNDQQGIENKSNQQDKRLFARNIAQVVDDLEARKGHGMPLPESLDEHFNRIKELSYRSFTSIFEQKESLQLSCGRLLHDIIGRMDAAIDHSSPVKFHVYSAHDTTLMCLPTAITGNVPAKWPYFASVMTFELYQTISGRYYIKVQHDNQELIIKDCGGSTECPFDRFKTVMSEFVIDREQYQEMCQIQKK